MSTPAKPQRLFKKFVEVGRVVRILSGENKNKLAVIVEIIDQHRVLVEGPTTGVARAAIRLSNVDLTNFRVKTIRAASHGRLKKDIAKRDFLAAWNATHQAKRIAAEKVKAGLNDFEKFKARTIRRQKEAIEAKHLKTVLAAAKLAAKTQK